MTGMAISTVAIPPRNVTGLDVSTGQLYTIKMAHMTLWVDEADDDEPGAAKGIRAMSMEDVPPRIVTIMANQLTEDERKVLMARIEAERAKFNAVCDRAVRYVTP